MREGAASLLSRQEKAFLAAAAAALAAVTVLAFYFAVPLSAELPAASLQPAPLIEAVRVDLNTAGLDALCTLPGIGESKAKAILEYRMQAGSFGSLSDLLEVPGITGQMLESWQGLVTLS